MLIGTICQLFIVPALFAVFQWLQEKIRPIDFNDSNNNAGSEIAQYTNPFAASALKGIIEARSKEK